MRIALLVATFGSLAILILTGCGGSSNPVQLPALEYFPLAQGNQWQYQVTDYTVDSAALSGRRLLRSHPFMGGLLVRSAEADGSEDDPGVSNLEVVISGTKWIGGVGWFEAVTIQDPLPTETIYYRHDANGLLVRGSEEEEPYYRIRDPLQQGHSWTLDSAGDYRLQITGVNVTVEVQAGSFSGCLQVEETGMWEGIAYRGINWFAPAVGLVRTQDHFDGELAVEAELTHYDLKGL